MIDICHEYISDPFFRPPVNVIQQIKSVAFQIKKCRLSKKKVSPYKLINQTPHVTWIDELIINQTPHVTWLDELKIILIAICFSFFLNIFFPQSGKYLMLRRKMIRKFSKLHILLLTFVCLLGVIFIKQLYDTHVSKASVCSTCNGILLIISNIFQDMRTRLSSIGFRYNYLNIFRKKFNE